MVRYLMGAHRGKSTMFPQKELPLNKVNARVGLLINFNVGRLKDGIK
jgi:hypothetical protein